jgi:anti-sigma regulatory factor (Ser/Thr protein kinase)
VTGGERAAVCVPTRRVERNDVRQSKPLLHTVDSRVTITYTTDLAAVRALVRDQASAAGLATARVADLVLAVSEVAANTMRHARSAGTLMITRDADEIVCEVRDAGVIADPLAGRRTPVPGALNGHGLWLVYQVCDRVELLSGADGTLVRMHMRITGGPP